MKFLNILLWIWQLPQHLLALLIRIFTKSVRIQYFKHCTIYFLKNKRWGVSLGNNIFLGDIYLRVSDSYRLKTIQHEYGHSRQSQYLGLIYLLIIGLPSFLRATIWSLFKLESKKYYQGYPEKWADKLGNVQR